MIDEFKEAMAHVPSPVSVVTTIHGGKPQGATVSAISSLSVTPPMVVLALDNRGSMISHLTETGVMGVNILAETQSDVALRFASHVEDRFAGISWTEHEGAARIAGATAWLHCNTLEMRPGGDHTIVMGIVDAAETMADDALTYFRRRFGSAQHGQSEPT